MIFEERRRSLRITGDILSRSVLEAYLRYNRVLLVVKLKRSCSGCRLVYRKIIVVIVLDENIITKTGILPTICK
jgi:hypothetical protein